MSMGSMCWFLLANAAAMMVMELGSRFSPSEVMDALSIIYLQFWLEPGYDVRPNPPPLSVLVRVMVLRITCIVCIGRMISLHPKVFISF